MRKTSQLQQRKVWLDLLSSSQHSWFWKSVDTSYLQQATSRTHGIWQSVVLWVLRTPASPSVQPQSAGSLSALVYVLMHIQKCFSNEQPCVLWNSDAVMNERCKVAMFPSDSSCSVVISCLHFGCIFYVFLTLSIHTAFHLWEIIAQKFKSLSSSPYPAKLCWQQNGAGEGREEGKLQLRQNPIRTVGWTCTNLRVYSLLAGCRSKHTMLQVVLHNQKVAAEGELRFLLLAHFEAASL